MKPRLIILDRDGVINKDSDDYIKSADEWVPIPGSIDAIAALSKANIMVAIATNQSGLARKLFDHRTLDAMHKKLTDLVLSAGGKINHIEFCPHGPNDHCQCRKPKPGLLSQIGHALSMEINQEVYFVGDSMKDLEAATAANCTPILVKTGKGLKSFVKLKTPENAHLQSVAVYNDLAEFVNNLLLK